VKLKPYAQVLCCAEAYDFGSISCDKTDLV
jgi:hypothetical protein